MDRTPTRPRNSRRQLVPRPALRPNRLAIVLRLVRLPSGKRPRPPTNDRRSLRPHPRSRPPTLQLFRPIPTYRRRHAPAAPIPIHPSHLFRLQTSTARHRLLRLLLLRTITTNRHIHGRRPRPRITVTNCRRPRIRNPRLELSFQRARRPKSRHPNSHVRPRNRLARNVRHSNLVRLEKLDHRSRPASKELINGRSKSKILRHRIAK